MLTAKFTHPNWGYPNDGSFAKTFLEVGNEYEVEFIDMGQSYTSIYLVDFKKPFNSVLFDFFEGGKEIDIFKSPKYNVYLWED